MSNNKFNDASEVQLTTFYLNDLLLGIQIDTVQEINKQLDCTEVPHAPPSVRGVVNLRGEVVTVLDPRVILGMERRELSKSCRNLIINSEEELVGLCVERVSDILTIKTDQIDPPPANLKGIDGRYFKGVHQLENEILVLLNINEVLNNSIDTAVV